ncbi:unnamed protein product [Ambrosiozyma monospora]|uniref:Unnamed protein product n=1 Tax=Ambrosiozyma monospora TaxID=43982 RepID=A0ACB5T339_AMBMO|nr:unnamed protein product [Ambrosiozyma monospora]
MSKVSNPDHQTRLPLDELHPHDTNQQVQTDAAKVKPINPSNSQALLDHLRSLSVNLPKANEGTGDQPGFVPSVNNQENDPSGPQSQPTNKDYEVSTPHQSVLIEKTDSRISSSASFTYRSSNVVTSYSPLNGRGTTTIRRPSLYAQLMNAQINKDTANNNTQNEVAGKSSEKDVKSEDAITPKVTNDTFFPTETRLTRLSTPPPSEDIKFGTPSDFSCIVSPNSIKSKRSIFKRWRSTKKKSKKQSELEQIEKKLPEPYEQETARSMGTLKRLFSIRKSRKHNQNDFFTTFKATPPGTPINKPLEQSDPKDNGSLLPTPTEMVTNELVTLQRVLGDGLSTCLSNTYHESTVYTAEFLLKKGIIDENDEQYSTLISELRKKEEFLRSQSSIKRANSAFSKSIRDDCSSIRSNKHGSLKRALSLRNLFHHSKDQEHENEEEETVDILACNPFIESPSQQKADEEIVQRDPFPNFRFQLLDLKNPIPDSKPLPSSKSHRKANLYPAHLQISALYQVENSSHETQMEILYHNILPSRVLTYSKVAPPVYETKPKTTPPSANRVNLFIGAPVDDTFARNNDAKDNNDQDEQKRSTSTVSKRATNSAGKAKKCKYFSSLWNVWHDDTQFTKLICKVWSDSQLNRLSEQWVQYLDGYTCDQLHFKNRVLIFKYGVSTKIRKKIVGHCKHTENNGEDSVFCAGEKEGDSKKVANPNCNDTADCLDHDVSGISKSVTIMSIVGRFTIAGPLRIRIVVPFRMRRDLWCSLLNILCVDKLVSTACPLSTFLLVGFRCGS